MSGQRKHPVTPDLPPVTETPDPGATPPEPRERSSGEDSPGQEEQPGASGNGTIAEPPD